MAIFQAYNDGCIKLKFITHSVCFHGKFISISIGFLWSALERAEAIVRQADIVAAFTLDVLKGTTRAFDSCECLVKGILYKRWTLYWFIGCNLLNITPEISYRDATVITTGGGL